MLYDFLIRSLIWEKINNHCNNPCKYDNYRKSYFGGGGLDLKHKYRFLFLFLGFFSSFLLMYMFFKSKDNENESFFNFIKK